MSDGVLTVGEALHHARARGIDRLDAQLLLAHVLARPRSWLIAHDDATLDAAQQTALLSAFARRAGGEPLAYVVGTKEFHGLALTVDPRVLVPRPETELLVDWALELLAGALAHVALPSVVDLGTGSGAIALAVKQVHAVADVDATDVSGPSLAVARANALRLGLDVAFLEGPWWAPIEGRRFDLALSNPPYIATGDSHLPALRHEPIQALSPGGDGLDALRQIVRGAPDHLQPGGWLLLEHGYDQAQAVYALLHQHGFTGLETRRDLGGRPRCSGGHR